MKEETRKLLELDRNVDDALEGCLGVILDSSVFKDNIAFFADDKGIEGVSFEIGYTSDDGECFLYPLGNAIENDLKDKVMNLQLSDRVKALHLIVGEMERKLERAEDEVDTIKKIVNDLNL